MNLELVKNGYAPTYFIWPVDNEEDYQQFQAAVAAAKKIKKEFGMKTIPSWKCRLNSEPESKGKA